MVNSAINDNGEQIWKGKIPATEASLAGFSIRDGAFGENAQFFPQVRISPLMCLVASNTSTNLYNPINQKNKP